MTRPTDTPSRARRRDTPPPRTGAAEKDVLLGFLDYLRSCVIAKVDGAPEPAAREPGVPSGTSLLGLLRHLGHVERAVFLGEKPGSWPATFRLRRDDSVASLTADYRAAIDAGNEVVAGQDDLAAAVGGRAGPGVPSLRWALTHMIEETGRHAGHMDILRELLDGSTGR